MSERYLYNNTYLAIIYDCRYCIIGLIIVVCYYRFYILNLYLLGGAEKILIKLIYNNLKTKTNIRTFIL